LNAMDPRELEALGRNELIEKAEALGVDKASLLTRAELADEIVRRTVTDPIERRIARGLLGVARDLVARVVERGLHLPDAAARIRGTHAPSWIPAKPPIATVTLAEIYARQGHTSRALSVLDEVLEKESDHDAARALREEIASSPDAEATEEPESDEPDSHERATSSEATSSEAGAGSTQTAPAEPVGMLDDAPLPEAYDVDEVVLMPVDPKSVFVYWEVRERTAAEARRAAPEGRLVVRIVAVTANWNGPTIETRDIDVSDRVGDWFVRDLPVGAVLRAAIGWSRATAFEPLSVAMDVTSPPGGPAAVGAAEVALFTPEGIVSSTFDAKEGGVALAIERARRRMGQEAAEARSSSSWPALPASPWSGGEAEPRSIAGA
jgi:hypothetical protein